MNLILQYMANCHKFTLFGVSSLDVLVYGTLTDCGQCLRSRASQGAIIVREHWHGRNIGARSKTKHSVIWWVLYGVESYVSEITFVADSKASAKASCAVAEQVPGKANSRAKVSVFWLPEHATVRS